MVPYFLVFVAALVLTYFGQKAFGRNKKIGIFIYFVVIIGLSTFAALRDYSVGADLLAHKQNYFDLSLRYESIGRYLSLFSGEYLFSSLVFLVSHITGSFRIAMFIFTFAPLSVLFYYGYKNNPKHMTLFLAAYLLTFFNTSLNVIRQTMAITLTIPAFFLSRDKKIFVSIILILAASLFHLSAILALVFIPINIFAAKKNQIKYYALVCLAFMILCFGLDSIANNNLFQSTGYAGYLKHTITNMNGYLFALKLCIFVFVTCFYRFYKEDIKCRGYYYLAILDLLFYLFSNYVMFGYRVSYYFVVFLPFLFASVAEKIRKKNRLIFYVGITIALVAYWLGRNIFIGYDATIPYLVGGALL